MQKIYCGLTGVFVFVILAVVTPHRAISQLPAGAVGTYTLNGNATDGSGSANNGTLSGTTAVTNRFGVVGSAAGFTSGSSSGTLPASLVTAVQNNFSVGFWFKTSASGNTTTQWYAGIALVDAEVCGQTNDWGTALINGGKLCFGVGNPDLTIVSAANYNDNAWHFATATRNASAGTIVLYADGVQVASSAGANTLALSSPTFIGLAQNPCAPSGVYTGSLDDILFYNRVLTSTEVGNMYAALSATALPVKWISFAGSFSAEKLRLTWNVEETTNSAFFEVEHSLDGVAFSTIGQLRSRANLDNNTGERSYHFDAPAPSGEIHYYRIKQIDKDGTVGYSKTIKLRISSLTTAFALQSNPVTEELLLLNNRQQLIREVSICDIGGRVLMRKAVNSSHSLLRVEVEQLTAGNYLLRVATAEKVDVLRLIKR